MAEQRAGQVVNVMKEGRLFPPPAEFAAKARIKSMEEYEEPYDADLELDCVEDPPEASADKIIEVMRRNEFI